MEKIAAALLASAANVAPQPQTQPPTQTKRHTRPRPPPRPAKTRYHRQQHRAAASEGGGADDDVGDPPPDCLVPDPQVRAELGGISHMTIWRWTNLPAYAGLNFPKAIVINGRNYRWRRALEAWKASQGGAT